MPTVIRLKRGGRTHSPYYRIVVIDSRNRNRGREVDLLGVYHPVSRPEPISQIDAHKALAWLKRGAQPSETARGVLSKLGVMKHFNDGTMPEEPLARHAGGAVEVKGYTPPAPPKEDPPAPAEAEAAPEAEAPAEAEATPEAEAPAEAEAAPVTETEAAAETAPAGEDEDAAKKPEGGE